FFPKHFSFKIAYNIFKAPEKFPGRKKSRLTSKVVDKTTNRVIFLGMEKSKPGANPSRVYFKRNPLLI
ncbi:hypothetical protein ED312_17715, partial [Sinomicrobium pectinilyticum]